MEWMTLNCHKEPSLFVFAILLSIEDHRVFLSSRFAQFFVYMYCISILQIKGSTMYEL